MFTQHVSTRNILSTQNRSKIRLKTSPDSSPAPREQIAACTEVKGWNWILGAGTYVDEITAESTRVRNRFALIGLAMVFLMAGLQYPMIRRTISVPLGLATVAAQQLATGDLTTTVDSDRSADQCLSGWAVEWASEWAVEWAVECASECASECAA